jgi:hypothetical protein
MKPSFEKLLKTPRRALRMASLGALAVTGLTGLTLSATPLLADISVRVDLDPPPPPPPREVIIGVAPSPDHVWVGGYWDGSPGHYRWVGGHWDRPPSRGAHWVAPRWERDHDGHYHQVRGEWRR